MRALAAARPRLSRTASSERRTVGFSAPAKASAEPRSIGYSVAGAGMAGVSLASMRSGRTPPASGATFLRSSNPAAATDARRTKESSDDRAGTCSWGTGDVRRPSAARPGADWQPRVRDEQAEDYSRPSRLQARRGRPPGMGLTAHWTIGISASAWVGSAHGNNHLRFDSSGWRYCWRTGGGIAAGDCAGRPAASDGVGGGIRSAGMGRAR